MPMRLRFAMHGVRNRRILHLVAINQRKARNAKPAELLGIYDPNLRPGEDEKKIEWSVDRIRYWLSVGAVPSKSVVKLLEAGKILSPDSPYSTAARLQPKYPVTPEAPTPSEEATPATEATS
ncbi:ribosomal protein S16 [Armillaria gallica]|uniref:Ribosomal protein S16 n=1 Tax=Armillaria gallica TaxID=47427 RepID=A0A2H3EMX3_ARMGA|nr:ribosomal protein S16 [Armillaria gallica]